MGSPPLPGPSHFPGVAHAGLGAALGEVCCSRGTVCGPDLGQGQRSPLGPKASHFTCRIRSVRVTYSQLRVLSGSSLASGFSEEQSGVPRERDPGGAPRGDRHCPCCGFHRVITRLEHKQLKLPGAQDCLGQLAVREACATRAAPKGPAQLPSGSVTG